MILSQHKPLASFRSDTAGIDILLIFLVTAVAKCSIIHIFIQHIVLPIIQKVIYRNLAEMTKNLKSLFNNDNNNEEEEEEGQGRENGSCTELNLA